MSFSTKLKKNHYIVHSYYAKVYTYAKQAQRVKKTH